MWRVAVVWVISCVAIFGVVRSAIAIPEHCGDLTTNDLDASISEAVAWMERNQLDTGVWLYRYDVVNNEDLGGYNWVRHAGVLLSLEQTARLLNGPVADQAEIVADRGWPAIEKNYRDVTIGGVRTTAMRSSSSATGGTALTGIALSERRVRTNDASLDQTLLQMARFVAAQVQDDGSVLNEVNLDTGLSTPGSFSPFATGQTMFLLARAREITQTNEFDSKIASIIRYLATQRAAREGYVPDVSDHWGAYGMAVLASSGPQFLSDREIVEFIRKQLGIAAIQVRYESQRTNDGLNRWTRGRQTLGAGLGTLGEAIGAWREVVAVQPVLRSQEPWLHERLLCVSELLVRRQVSAEQAQKLSNPDSSQGSWTQFGITQMDDQQHALSAMVAARIVDVDAPNAPRRMPIPESALLVIFSAIAVMNPARLAQRGASCSRIQLSVGGVVVIAIVTIFGGPLLRALNVSAATALVGAGAAVVVTALISLGMQMRPIHRSVNSNLDFLLNGFLRPETLLLAIAVGAGGQGWTWVVTAAFIAGGAMAVPTQWVERNHVLVTWLTRLLMVSSIALGVVLIVDGVYAV